MPGNFIRSNIDIEQVNVNFIQVSDVINLARNSPNQDLAKHMIIHMLRFYTRQVENSDNEQQLLRNFILQMGW